ncbi:MAG: helix-turn-helix transcriptional regulator [Actinomycetes bacterium]
MAATTAIGRRLKQLRGGLTQKEAAARVGLHYSTWQKIELGVTARPEAKNIRAIATGFGVDYDELWSYVDRLPAPERFTDEELDRLAIRLAPLLADRLNEIERRR